MSRVTFRVAGAGDDDGIRALLRASSMAGSVSLSLRREPNYFAASLIGGRETTIVAEDAGRIVCVGSVAVRDRYVNGQALPVGYLGQLRLAASHAGRYDLIRRGYAFFDALRDTLGAATYFTSIASDNRRALRLLGSSIRGLPVYQPIGELVTMLLPTARFRSPKFAPLRIETAQGRSTITEPPALDDLFETVNVSFQFAPVWSAETLDRLEAFGLSENDWMITRPGRQVGSAAALWDQRAFKQVVVTGYSPWLRRLRWAYNLFADVAGLVPLPRVGSVLPQAFISPLAVRDEEPDSLNHMLQWIGYRAKINGIGAITLAMDARDPRLPRLRARFRPRVYDTRLFTVSRSGEAAVPLDVRLLYPDAALL